MSTEVNIKKPRAAAQVWKPFYRVGRTDVFFIGKTRLVKAGYITAYLAHTGDKRFVNPFRRVRTAEPVKKVVTWKGRLALTANLDPGQESAGGTTPEQNDASFNRGLVSQPHSDNGISGPTS